MRNVQFETGKGVGGCVLQVSCTLLSVSPLGSYVPLSGAIFVKRKTEINKTKGTQVTAAVIASTLLYWLLTVLISLKRSSFSLVDK